MAEKIRHIAHTLLMVTLSAGAAHATELTGLSIVSTKGPKVLHRVEAETGRIKEGEGIVEAGGIKLWMVLSTGQEASATADRGVVVLSGDKETASQLFGGRELTQEDVQQYGEQFEELSHPGDILLDSTENETEAQVGTQARLLTRQLIWSECLRELLVPADFRQVMTMETGGEVEISGAAAKADSDFTHWTYFANDRQDAMMAFEKPAEAKGDADAKE